MDLAAAEAANEFRFDDIPVVLRRKPPARVWTARISLGVDGGDRGRIERSTGERELKNAVSVARRLHGELAYRAEKGESFKATTFDQAVRAYLDSFEKDVSAGVARGWRLERVRVSLERYYVPYFKGRRIDAISHNDLTEHARWRLKRHETAPTSIVTYQRDGKTVSRPHVEVAPGIETLRKERQHFAWLMSYSVKRGWLKAEAVPTYEKLHGKGEPRGSFDPDEMRRLQEVSISRVQKKKHKPTRRQWVLNHFRFMFIYMTGCRPQEITRLRFRHLKVGNDVTGTESYLIDLPLECLKKKESHKRAVVPLPGFRLLVDTIVQFYKEIDGVAVTDDDFIFRSPSGDIIKKTAKTFKGLLYAMEQGDDPAADNDNIAANDTDDEADDDNDQSQSADRTLYSFRHTFATERLYEGFDLGRLSRWMGTSVEMIEQHYGHALSHLELTGQCPPWSHVVVDFRLSNFGYDVDRQKEPARVAEFRELIRKSLPETEIPNALDRIVKMPPRVSWIRTRAK